MEFLNPRKKPFILLSLGSTRQEDFIKKSSEEIKLLLDSKLIGIQAQIFPCLGKITKILYKFPMMKRPIFISQSKQLFSTKKDCRK